MTSFDLPGDVASGDDITVVIDMVAPSDAGQYTAIWQMASSDRVICNMGISIIVK